MCSRDNYMTSNYMQMIKKSKARLTKNLNELAKQSALIPPLSKNGSKPETKSLI